MRRLSKSLGVAICMKDFDASGISLTERYLVAKGIGMPGAFGWSRRLIGGHVEVTESLLLNQGSIDCRFVYQYTLLVLDTNFKLCYLASVLPLFDHHVYLIVWIEQSP